MIEQIQNQPEDTVRRQIALMAGGVLLATAVGAGGAIVHNQLQQSSTIETGDSADKYIIEKPENISEQVEDPRQRATSVSFLKDGFKMGSASLFRSENGTIHMITVEHVARPFAHMPNTVHETVRSGSIIGNSKQDADSDNRAFVPGVGLLSDLGKPVFFDGARSAFSDQGVDRFADIPLTQHQQDAINKAEETGKISVPERSTVKPELGDILYMPSAQSGEKIPLMFISADVEGTGLEVIPLIILDINMNPETARTNLDAMKEKIRAKLASVQAEAEAGGGTYTFEGDKEKHILYSAFSVLQLNFEKKYAATSGDNQARATEISEYLTCHGDSGAPLLDSEGNTLGVLSHGDGFSTQLGFARDQFASMSCLGKVVFDKVPSKF